MSGALDGVFQDFTKSIFSMADKKYERKRHKSYLNEKFENRHDVYMDTILSSLDRYADDVFIEEVKERFRELVGKEGNYKDRETIGTHPDFKYLEGTDGIENHYIVSMFVDIKNSTSIYLKTGDLVWTKTFKNTVLRIITIFMQVFDGHIHRLQGDAVFGYFGWKDKGKEDAIIDSLNAASFLLWYIKNGLNPQLEQYGYDPLQIRIGIDFGEESEVIWSEYGLNPATEVTTTSIHTDLAAKLQNRASSNTIMIGDNIREFLDLPDEFIAIKTYQENHEAKEDRYILRKPEKRYKMWIFKHENYLKYFPILENENFAMKCYADGIQYFPNISALNKNVSLVYVVSHPLTVPYRRPNNIRFIWVKENRGKAARKAENEGRSRVSSTRDNEADEATAYRGHHTMICRVMQNERAQATLKFGIFIK